MNYKPTYDDLEKRIKQLEEENRKLRDALKMKSISNSNSFMKNPNNEKSVYFAPKSESKSNFTSDWFIS